jgi:hypothetical protein
VVCLTAGVHYHFCNCPGPYRRPTCHQVFWPVLDCIVPVVSRLKFRCQCFLCGCKATRLLKRGLTSAMLRGRHIILAPWPSKTLGDVNDCQSLPVYSSNKGNTANNKGVCNGFVNGVNCWISSTYMCVRSVFFVES